LASLRGAECLATGLVVVISGSFMVRRKSSKNESSAIGKCMEG
jgi:hypothetical protein